LLGLSTAVHLIERDPGLDVVVLDAGEVATGASGRGTGLLGPRVGPAVDRARERYGDEVARRMYLASVEAVHRVRDLVSRLDIRCGLRDGDQFVVAASEHGAQALSRQAAGYRELGLDVPVLSGAQLRDRVDVPYRLGLCYRDAATLDPAALTRGLADTARRHGVRLYPYTPVLGLARHGRVPGLTLGSERQKLGSWPAASGLRSAATREDVALQATGPGEQSERQKLGVLRARTVVLAVNAYAPALRRPAGGVLPLEVSAVATGPLDPATYAALGGPDGYAVVDVHPMAPYFRTTPDGRLIAGGGRPTLTGGRPADQRWLADAVRALHPRLRQVEMAYAWHGRIGMTGDGLPVVGRVAGQPDVWYAGGCNGHGLAMSVAHGAHLADILTGAPGPDLPWYRDRAPWLPVGGPARPLLRGYLAALDRFGGRGRDLTRAQHHEWRTR
jgi:glycine/D-amino acid oxidase-like deaminating enzyme